MDVGKKGQVVIVPPGWAHCTINAKPDESMMFGAWCVRDYGFDYQDIRKHKGFAYFPKVKGEKIVFEKNPEIFRFVTNPEIAEEMWKGYQP